MKPPKPFGLMLTTIDNSQLNIPINFILSTHTKQVQQTLPVLYMMKDLELLILMIFVPICLDNILKSLKIYPIKKQEFNLLLKGKEFPPQICKKNSKKKALLIQQFLLEKRYYFIDPVGTDLIFFFYQANEVPRDH